MIKKTSYILGIHDGHNCGATLIGDGVILSSVNEERLTRIKNEAGYPRRSVEEVLRVANVDSSLLDEVVYASLFMHATSYLKDISSWYHVGLSEQMAAKAQPKEYQDLIFQQRKKERIDAVVEHLGVSNDKVTFVEHHLAHLTAAYYTAPKWDRSTPTLGLTCDGAGDGLSATVSICEGNSFRRIATTDRHASLGKIYSRVTYLLGLTPWEHEYKVMGLAPYAESKLVQSKLNILEELIHLRPDGLGFALSTPLSTNYCYEYLRERFERARFDVIAGTIQLFTEKMLVGWVREAIKATGIRKVVCGGGVFMNVKANMIIAQLEEVTDLYIMPTASDESLSIGAALYRYYDKSSDKNYHASHLQNLYLGGEFTAQQERLAIEEAKNKGAFIVDEPTNMDFAIGELLAEGQITAVCRGRMEWGARSLGNRSILAAADDFRRVDQINKMIKMRDFWMPFAPAIIEEQASKYYENPKKVTDDFMAICFPSRSEAALDISASMHPRDGTLRPQAVRKNANPGFHAAISQYFNKTGRGGVLNTSFNIHGSPIVYTPADAIDVFLRSGLKYLALGNYVLNKKAG